MNELNQENKKKKYKKRNEFKFNIFFNEQGENLEKIIERTFGRYCVARTK